MFVTYVLKCFVYINSCRYDVGGINSTENKEGKQG